MRLCPFSNHKVTSDYNVSNSSFFKLDAARIITNICYNLLLEITRYASISDVYNLINFDLISLTPVKVCLQTFCCRFPQCFIKKRLLVMSMSVFLSQLIINVVL